MAGVRPYESASEDDEEYDVEPEITLRSIENRKTIHFPIRANYTKWAPREAFRELVQNWRDAIIKTFDLAERDFRAIRKEEPTSDRSTDWEIIYKVPRPGTNNDTEEWLGYIRFRGRDGEGTIEITNRGTTLQPWHLDLGGTSKASDANQAGAHGEGLKIALLVLMRGHQNHSVRCSSGGFSWKFNFTTQGRLVARLSRMKPKAIQKVEDQAQRPSQSTLLPFRASPKSDVQFLIGESQPAGRDERGEKTKRRKVKREDFDAWTKSALFLQEHKGTISTANGDLLTDSQLCCHIYLKGFLLCESTPTRSASITNEPLKFGYNFASGTTNRERQSLASAREESRAILAIWTKALVEKPEMVSELSAMLNTTEPRYADVYGAKAHMDFGTACRLKDHLLGPQFAGKWYYCSEDMSKNPRLDHIIQGLGCEGVELTKTYWDILRRHNLIRTAEEEECRRFTAAALVPTAALGSDFAKSVSRLLSACVGACSKTRGIAISFVQAGQLHLQLFYSEAERLFRAHERWLSVEGAVEELGLPDDLVETDVVFHTVKRLFADALEQLPRDVFVEEDTSRTAEWRRKWEVSRTEQRLLDYLRMGDLRIDTIPGSLGLRLTWTAGCRQPGVEIQCHRASQCSHLMDSLLTSDDASVSKMACIARQVEDDSNQRTSEDEMNLEFSTPGCRVSQSHWPRGEHCEHDLEEGEEYFFVLVTPADPESFVGLSPTRRLDPRPPSPAPSSVVSPPLVGGHDMTETQEDRLSVSSVAEPLSWRADRQTSVLGSGAADEEFNTDIGNEQYNTGTENGNDESMSCDRVGAALLEQRLARIHSQNRSRPEQSVTANASPAIADAPTPAPAAAPAAAVFTLGSRLRNLDIFSIDREQWYEARNAEDVQAVIGILSGEEPLAEETRKRRRVD